MNASEQALQQIKRALKKVVSKYPAEVENLPLTDLYLQVKQESGELLIFNDDDTELTRCVVEEWIDNTDEHFYEEVQPVLKQCVADMKTDFEHMGILKPFSILLTDEEKETLADLYYVDDDTIVLDGELMQGLDDDLERFWEELMKR